MQVISHNAPAAKFGNAGAAKTVAKKAVQQGVQTFTKQAPKAPIQKAGVGKFLNKLG